jgi:hypothetical protein
MTASDPSVITISDPKRRDWIFQTIDSAAIEVQSAKASTSWIRQHVFRNNYSSYDLFRKAYQLNAHSLLKEHVVLQKTSRTFWLNFTAIYEKFATPHNVKLFLILYVSQSFFIIDPR